MSEKVPRPLHFRPGLLALVFVAGGCGAGLRYALTIAFPGSGSGVEVGLVINVAGSFCLGFLLESITRRGAAFGFGPALQVGVGSGLLGGFTTYSTLAVSAAELVGGGRPWFGIGYGVLSVVLGVVGAGAGVLLSGAVVPERTHVLEDEAIGDEAVGGDVVEDEEADR